MTPATAALVAPASVGPCSRAQRRSRGSFTDASSGATGWSRSFGTGGTSHAKNPSNAALMATYGFDESTGLLAPDAPGNDNRAVLTNVTHSSQAKFGRTLSRNGRTSLVTVTDSACLDLNNAMGLSAWAYAASWTSDWNTLLFKVRSGDFTQPLGANSNLGQAQRHRAHQQFRPERNLGTAICRETYSPSW